MLLNKIVHTLNSSTVLTQYTHSDTNIFIFKQTIKTKIYRVITELSTFIDDVKEQICLIKFIIFYYFIIYNLFT